jgi:RP/EB family microtubule-associated protein
MLQWIKQFFEKRYAGQPYNASERRQKCVQQYRAQHRHAGAVRKRKPALSKAAASSLQDENKSQANRGAVTVPSSTPSAFVGTASTGGKKKTSKAAAARRAASAAKANAAIAHHKGLAAASAGQAKAAAREVTALNATIGTLRVTVEGLEKERNFYFGKLREIEILCQTDESIDEATKQRVLAILYHTDDNDEFQAPPEGADGAATATAAAQQQQPEVQLQQQAASLTAQEEDVEVPSESALLTDAALLQQAAVVTF